jgi:hypothetical protein
MSAIFSQPIEITVITPYPSKITLSVSPSSGQEGTTFTASGTVYDQNGNPLSGVPVYLFFYLCGSSRGGQVQWYHVGSPATTDSNGNFSITFTGSAVMSAMGLTTSEANLVFAVVASNQDSVEPSGNPPC